MALGKKGEARDQGECRTLGLCWPDAVSALRASCLWANFSLSCCSFCSE